MRRYKGGEPYDVTYWEKYSGIRWPGCFHRLLIFLSLWWVVLTVFLFLYENHTFFGHFQSVGSRDLIKIKITSERLVFRLRSLYEKLLRILCSFHWYQFLDDLTTLIFHLHGATGDIRGRGFLLTAQWAKILPKLKCLHRPRGTQKTCQTSSTTSVVRDYYQVLDYIGK